FVIVVDGRDAGFVQTYRVADYPESWPFDVGPDAAGMDLAIGDRDLGGRGLGPQVVAAFVGENVFAHPAVTARVAAPAVRYRRAGPVARRAAPVADGARRLRRARGRRPTAARSPPGLAPAPLPARRCGRPRGRAWAPRAHLRYPLIDEAPAVIDTARRHTQG